MRSNECFTYLAVCFALLLASCAGEVEDLNAGNSAIRQVACSTHQAVFDTDIWPVLTENCFSCHKLNGVSSELVLLPELFNNYSQANFNTFQKVAVKKDSKGVSLLITKPISRQ